MKDAVIVSQPDGFTEVYGMHGGVGLIQWKRMVVGEHLFGDWQSVDFNRFEPGAASADHIQSRTEEIWFVAYGQGEASFDGDQVREMRTGDLLITPQYGRHGMKNIGDGHLEVLVIEVFPPSVADVLPVQKPTEVEG